MSSNGWSEMRPADSPQWLERIGACARRIADGDLTALGSLFDHVGPRLVRYAQAVLRNSSDAEDAVQAAMIRLTRHPEGLASAQVPWAYCLRVVRNEAVRLTTRRRPTSALSERQLTAPPGRWPIEEEELRQQVLRALERLPSEQAEVVVLKVWENLTFAEIADITGERLNTVASRYRYALEKLQSALESLAQETGHV